MREFYRSSQRDFRFDRGATSSCRAMLVQCANEMIHANGGLGVGQRVALGLANEFPEGGSVVVTVNQKDVAVFRSNGQFFAIDDLCPHMGASLAGGFLSQGIVTCPWHAWRFKTCDGTWCDNPKIKIDHFPVRIVEDEIQVLIEPKTANDGLSRRIAD